MLDVWQKLQQENRPLILYGMGNGAEIMIKQLAKYNLSPAGFMASEDFVRGQYFKGFKVMTFNEAKEKFPDMIVLISFGTQREEVIDYIQSLDAEIYAPEVPVVGESTFTYDFAKKNKAKIEEAYNLLSDEQSKKVFKEIIEYKLDGEISHLFKAETEKEEMMSLFHLSSNEIFVDLGAYNGDTVLDFVNRVNNYKNIIALEPDEKNFKKLINNTKHLENITYINKAISDREETVFFSNKGGRNSRLGGEREVWATSIDAINQPASFIKMDVEGEEEKAILGAKQTIKQCRPQMLISAYHRSEDIFALPLLVKSINPDYKVYLRHQRYIPAWDTNYCFV